MDLKLFFDPVQVDVDRSPSSFQSSIYINQSKMPDSTGMDLALIGLSERRGGSNGKNYSPDEVREALFKLKKGFGDYGIIDLGNLRNGPTLDETYLRVKEVCAYLMSKDIIPILFGGSHDLDIGQFLSYESSDKMVSMLNIDKVIDLDSDGKADESHLSKIFKHHPNFLFNYHHLAYQSYLTIESDLELLQGMSFDYTRLGDIKKNLASIEPVIRESDFISFDMSAIQSIYSASSSSEIFGLTGEEACQICWYAGQNEKLSSFGLYNYFPDKNDNKGAFLAATMIWYFIEGYYHRKGDKNFKSNDYLVYEVHINAEPDTIRFYKSKLSDRWWMEIPNEEGYGVFNRSRMISCDYTDYEIALKGEVPERWFNAVRKL